MKTFLTKTLSIVLVFVLFCGIVPMMKVEADAYYSVSRDDGVWLFPLASNYYYRFTDFAGCVGYANVACPFCGYAHPAYADGEGGHQWQAYYGGHNGIDIGAETGVSVYSPAAGVVVGASYQGSRGYTVMVKHDIGNGWSYYSYSQHLNSILVSVGNNVFAGTVVGTVGSSGGNYGSHLHFGIVMAPSNYTFSQVLNVDSSGATSDNNWLTTTGYKTGKLVTNPKNGGTNMESVNEHRGSVTYTFDKNKVSLPNATVSTTSISLNVNSSTVDIGETIKLTATVSPSNATNKNVTWTSSDTSVATVSGGTVKGVKAGVATITAKASGGQTATCKVVVFPSTATPTAITEYNGHLYELYDYTSSWKDAKEFCEAKGGHLVTITSKSENDAMYNLAQKGNKARYCLGATDETTESNWLWVTGEKFSYSNFLSGEDTDSTDYEAEDYLFMYTNNGQWGDVRNYAWDPTVNGFICEYDNLLTYDNVTVIGDKVYELYEREYPISVATTVAESRGGNLVSLTSEAEQSALIAWIQVNSDILYISIGANDLSTEGTWEWSSGERFEYTSWVEGEPNDTNGIEDNAILILGSGKWNDVSGANAYSFVIEYDLEKWLDAGNDADDIVFNELPDSADPDDYEIVTEYRYRNKETTTSTASSLSGWTLYDSDVTYGSWGSTQTTNTKPTESDTLQITGTTTKYKYYHYWNYYGGCNCIDSISYGTNKGYHEIYLTYQLSAVSMEDQGGKQAYGSYTCGNEGFNYWFYGGTVTTYSYQTRTKTTTNHFYKYGAWSDWSTDIVTATSNRQVETRTVYKLKDHKHTLSSWITDREATVYKAGSKYKECTECGEVLKTAAIPQLKCATPVLKKVSNANSYVKITWGTVKGADLYRVYRRIGTGDYEYIGSTTNTYFNDKKAPAGKTCRYRIRVKNEAGYSEYSASIAIKHIDEPTLKSIENSAYGVLIKWDKVTGAEKYNVYRKVSGGEYKYIGATSNTYYTDKTAKSGTKYYYAIRGKRDDSVSSQSASLSKYYLEDPTLNTPTTTSKGVGLRWSKVAGAEGYMVYRRTTSGSYKKITTEKGVSNVTFRDTTAKKDTKYYYKVKAYYSKTYSAYSNTKSITDKY